jgi:hypothetical protein
LTGADRVRDSADGIGFIQEQGCRILLLDFSDLRDQALTLARIEDARRFVAQQPKRKEILTLVDVTRMRYDNEVLKAFQDLTRHDEPWERAVAVFGLRGVGLIAFRANNLLTGSRLRGFGRREEAVAWLVQQTRP